MIAKDRLTDSILLTQARAEFFSKLDEGTTCPCCRRYARRYRRKLNSSMAAALMSLVRLSAESLLEKTAQWKPGDEVPTAWVHADAVGRDMKQWSRASYPHGEMGKLAHWNLIEPQPQDGSNGGQEHAGRTSGFWRPTQGGVDFVHKRASLSRVVVLWDNVVEGFEGDEVTIDDVLGDRFSYSELMGNTGDTGDGSTEAT